MIKIIYQIVSASVFSLVLTLLCATQASAATYNPANFSHIIENVDRTSTLRLEGSAWDNTLVRNCKIHDTDIGIFIRDVKNVVITNCEIYNISGLAAIQLSSNGGSDRVTLDGNTIRDTQQNGIMTGQRENSAGTAIEVNHTNLKIINNKISRTGKGGDKLHHGIYNQATEFLIEGNTILDHAGGNCISVRSSGTIRGNTVGDCGTSGITYFSDHWSGPSYTLTIENNIAYDAGNHPSFTYRSPIELLSFSSNTTEARRVKNFSIRFNTAVSPDANVAPLIVDPDYSGGTYTVNAIGNLLVNARGTTYLTGPIDSDTKNYKSQSLTNFVKSTSPYDFHITSSHGARGYATGVSGFPATDIDGQARSASALDAGADQYGTGSGTTPPPTTGPCQNYYTSSLPIPTGYGAAYNLFSSARELLIAADCSGTVPKLKAGSGATTQYIYNQGYAYRGSAWQSLSLTGPTPCPELSLVYRYRFRQPSLYRYRTLQLVLLRWLCLPVDQ